MKKCAIPKKKLFKTNIILNNKIILHERGSYSEIPEL